MIQQTCTLHSKEEFLEWVEKVKASTEYKTARNILIRALSSLLPDEDIKDSPYLLNKLLPGAKIIGMSLTRFGSVLKHSDAPFVVISVFYFFKSDVTILECGGAQLEYGDPSLMLKDKLLRIPNIKAVEVLCAGKSRYLSSFMETITEGLEHVDRKSVV